MHGSGWGFDRSGARRHANADGGYHSGEHHCPLLNSASYLDIRTDVHADASAAQYSEGGEIAARHQEETQVKAQVDVHANRHPDCSEGAPKTPSQSPQKKDADPHPEPYPNRNSRAEFNC